MRERWGSRTAFIFASVASAVGLGNIWRFPYVAWENGGGAFFVPYLIALFTAGIPILILEYALGHRFQGSAPATFRRLARRSEWIGWAQVVIAFVIATYYAVIIAWAAAYTWFSLRLSWGDDPEAFFFERFIGVAEPGRLGAFRPAVLVPLALVWLVTLLVAGRGVRRGIERANWVFIPLLIVMFLALVVRAVTLPGAATGLDALFTPDWSRITDGAVWIAAYGQIFFSLSVAFAIMITYASYLPRDAELGNNGFITAFGNSSFELLAGIGVFAAVGFLAASQGVGVDEVARDGIGLAFVVFPQIISEMPAMNPVFGVLFFGSLVVAGLSSLISIVETYVSAAQDKFGIARVPAVAVGGGATVLVSLLFATSGGMNLLDVTDHFINGIGIGLIGLMEVIAVAWLVRRLRELQRHANATSEVRVGAWWRWALRVVTPLVLGYMLFDSTRTELASNYEDYPTWFLVTFGWGAVALVFVAGVALAWAPWRRSADRSPAAQPELVEAE